MLCFLPRRGNHESCTAQTNCKKPDLVSKSISVYLRELVIEVVAEVIQKVAQLKTGSKIHNYVRQSYGFYLTEVVAEVIQRVVQLKKVGKYIMW